MSKFNTDPHTLLGVSPGANRVDVLTAYQQRVAQLKQQIDAGNTHAGIRTFLAYVEDAYERLSKMSGRELLDISQQNVRALSQLRMRPVLSKQTIESLLEPQVIYLYLDLVTANQQAVNIEPNLNLTLVLDHSNSMDGIRLDRVKFAATEIIDQLTEQDYLSVVGFNDRADVIIPASSVRDKKKLASRIRMTRASGGTEIFKGLEAGVMENRKNARPDRINHIILLTDGKTYGDQDNSLKLARAITGENIGISTLGLGTEWNDKFLDEIASLTGGSSEFIRSANSVVSFMNNHIKKLANVYADNIQMIIAPSAGVDIEMVFKLKPSPQPLPHTESPLLLGGLEKNRSLGVILQMQLAPNMAVGLKRLAQIVVYGHIVQQNQRFTMASDIMAEISNIPNYDEPPDEILDGLGKLTLYRMQERAQEAVQRGDITEATRSLNNLATRLIDIGEEELAQEALSEMRRIEQTSQLSEEGQKSLKYQTRYLINPDTSDKG